MTRSIGLLGGSFDPPHLAHLALARAAIDQLPLDELRWLPAGLPWQKQREGRVLAPAADRLAMLHALVDGEPRMAIDDREMRRTGPSYTIDTLRELAAEQPGARLWLVLGQDQYARLDTWRDWPQLLQRAGLAVAARSGQAVQGPPDVAATPHALRVLRLPELPHAATDIRRLAAEGAAIDALATLAGTPVARYIALHSLYRPHPGARKTTP